MKQSDLLIYTVYEEVYQANLLGCQPDRPGVDLTQRSIPSLRSQPITVSSELRI